MKTEIKQFFIMMAAFISFLFFISLTSAQLINDSVLASFYNQIIQFYFSDTTTTNDLLKYGSLLVRTDLDSGQLISQVGKNKLCIYRYDINTVLAKPFEVNNGRTHYYIKHRIINKDTIDINIEGSTLNVAGSNHLIYDKWKQGKTYIPDGRFIFNKETDNWDLITGEEISSIIINRAQ